MDLFSYEALNLSVIFATIFYSIVGIILMVVSVVAFDKLFNLDLHKELVEDENIAFGILIAGMSIAIAIIIGASIAG